MVNQREQNLKKSLKYIKDHPPCLDKEHLKELKKLGFKPKKPTTFVIHKKPGHCMYCGSKKIEPSWGTGGYMQCNRCGKEWRGV